MFVNVLIVDDEFLSRINIKNMLDWEKYGFNIAGEAENGIEALEFIKNHPVHLVITDVFMTKMSGVELLKRIHEDHPQIKVLVVSGYDDFQSVRETFKSGAVDYMLKHTLSEEDVLPLLLKTRNELLQNTPVGERNKKTVRLLSPSVRENYIRDLILGTKSIEDVKEFFDLIGESLLTERLAIAVIEIINYDLLVNTQSFENIKNILTGILNISIETLQDGNGDNIISLENGMFVIVFPFSENRSDAKMKSIIKTYILRIRNTVNNYFNLCMAYGISLPKNNAEIHDSYLAACRELSSADNKPYSNTQSTVASLSLKHEKELLSAFFNFDKFKTFECIDEIFDSLTQDSASFKMLSGEILSIAVKFSLQFDLNIQEILNELNMSFDDIKKLNTKHELKQYIKSLLGLLIEKTDDLIKYSNCTDKLKPVIDYVNHNYAKNISINKIAQAVCFSPNWLSEIFKRETGQTLSSYISKVRIANAKKIISSGEQNLQLVAHQVGFNYYSYFSMVFKKETGMTPMDYLHQSGNK